MFIFDPFVVQLVHLGMDIMAMALRYEGRMISLFSSLLFFGCSPWSQLEALFYYIC